MPTSPSTTISPRSFDDRGHAVQLSEIKIRETNARALAALDAIQGIGDEAEQREMLDYLARWIDEHRLSDRSSLGT